MIEPDWERVQQEVLATILMSYYQPIKGAGWDTVKAIRDQWYAEMMGWA